MKLSRIVYFVVLFTVSCGYYSLKGTIPSHLNNIVVMPIINDSNEYNIGELLSDKFLEALLKENILSITSFDKADCKLSITIKK